LAGGGGVEGDVGRDDDDQDHAGEAVDTGGVDGCAEDVDERVAGGVVEGGVDVVDGEQVRDQEDDGHDPVADVGPKDGDGHVAACVADFFGHVRGCIAAWGLLKSRISGMGREMFFFLKRT